MSQYPCKILSPEEQVQAYELNKRYHRAYDKSAKGKASRKRYRQTEKYKATMKRYRQTEKYKLDKKIYNEQRSRNRPLLIKSMNAVRDAIVHGKLPPLVNERCHYCNEQAQLYHHYIDHEPSHWLDVVPCCYSCNNKQPIIDRKKKANPNPQLAPRPDWMDAFERTG